MHEKGFFLLLFFCVWGGGGGRAPTASSGGGGACPLAPLGSGTVKKIKVTGILISLCSSTGSLYETTNERTPCYLLNMTNGSGTVLMAAIDNLSFHDPEPKYYLAVCP